MQMDRNRQRFKNVTGSGAQRAFVRMVKMACDFAKCRTVEFKSKIFRQSVGGDSTRGKKECILCFCTNNLD